MTQSSCAPSSPAAARPCACSCAHAERRNCQLGALASHAATCTRGERRGGERRLEIVRGGGQGGGKEGKRRLDRVQLPAGDAWLHRQTTGTQG
eukprot:1157902-Pelagomonas_calceolata.AAC.13